MRIDTDRPIMGKRIRTPNSLILLQIEIIVTGEQMYHLYFNFSLDVSEGTELLVIAFYVLVCVRLAEF